MAIANEVAVQELAAVVGVEPEQDERQPAADGFKCGEHVVLALAGHAHALGPAARDVSANQCEQVLAVIADAAVGDQIDV